MNFIMDHISGIVGLSFLFAILLTCSNSFGAERLVFDMKFNQPNVFFSLRDLLPVSPYNESTFNGPSQNETLSIGPKQEDLNAIPGQDVVSIGPKQENLTANTGAQALVGPDDNPELIGK